MADNTKTKTDEEKIMDALAEMNTIQRLLFLTFADGLLTSMKIMEERKKETA